VRHGETLVKKLSIFTHPTCIWHPRWGVSPLEFREYVRLQKIIVRGLLCSAICFILHSVTLVEQAVTPLCGEIACARPSVRPRKPRPRCGIAILACPPPPEPSIPARSQNAPSPPATRACRIPTVRPHKLCGWHDIFTIRLLYIDTNL